MDPLPALDLMLSDAETGKDRLTRAVQSAVAAALAELVAVEAFEGATASFGAYHFDRPVATAVRGLFEAWVSAAEALQGRVADATVRAGRMAGADKLEYAIGKTLARLSVSLDDMEQSALDGIEGRETRYASVEEMRRELLHPRVPGPGAGPTPPAEPVVAGGGA